MFLAQKFLGEGPKFLDLHYKVHPDSDHVVKFHGDRLQRMSKASSVVASVTQQSRHRVPQESVAPNVDTRHQWTILCHVNCFIQ